MKKISLVIFVSCICFISYFLVFTGFNTNSNGLISGYSNSITSPPPGSSKNFVNCIFNDAYESWNHQAWVLKFLDRYKDSLHFNTIQYYNYPEVSNYYGTFNLPMTQSQITHNIDLLDSVGIFGLKTFTARQNIEKYCYGQRLIYEVSSGGSTTINDGFCYQTIMPDTYTTDSGRTVLHAIPSQQQTSGGYLCKDIYENLQHTDLYDFVQLDGFTWHLKPMMRIPKNIFSNTDTTKVAAVIVKNYSGSTIDSIIIRINNFKDVDTTYSGKYLDTYSFSQQDLLITSGSSQTGLGAGRDGDFRSWVNNCKVDFGVYWFGEVEVWFDKMTVDDDRARRLFDPTSSEIPIDSLIRQEANELGSHAANFSFFVDEVTYSNNPCINYVDSVLKSANPNAKLHTAITNYFQIRGFKNNEVGQRVYFQQTNLNSFNADAHVIDWYVKIPNNFNHYDSLLNPGWKCDNYNQYNNQLQSVVFGDKTSILSESINITENDPPYWGSLIYQVNLSRSKRDLYSPNSKFIMQPQIHSNIFKADTAQYYEYGNREPTNEEIHAETMVSIAHGAEGLCWFLYPSVKSLYNSGTLKNYYQGVSAIDNSFTTYVYNFGLTNLLQDDPTLSPRYSNMYGQDKWNFVKKMNIKIEHWKPTLDEISWQEGFSIHSEGSDHNYISDIKSIYRDSQSPYDFNSNNEDQTKYWEMGFFEPDFDNPNVSINDKSKYFLMVNRRCFPEMNFDGDIRKLKIKFNSNDLAGFNNWKIIELDSNKVISTFDKDSNLFVDMGIFQPGEGKLYKLAPVMQEGGTLIADESLSGVTFSCKGDVDNNGKNISIYVGTNINFADGVKWNIDGGEFKSGLYPDSPNELKVNMKSQSGAYWNGIDFTGCDIVNIANTVFENVKPSGAETVNPSALQFTDCYDLTISGCKFNFANLDSVICININYLENEEEHSIISNILYNEFNTGSNKYSTLICAGFAESVIPLMINGNDFNSANGNIAIFLSNVSAGVIKNNEINNYSTGINIISSLSYADLYNNDITGDSGISGANIYDGIINLGLQGQAQTGGFNEISSGDPNANNLYSGEGYFLINQGLNTFNINNNSTAYHLSGMFPDIDDAFPASSENCFKLSNSESDPRENVDCLGAFYGSNCQVIFSFEPTICAIEQNEEYLIVDLGNQVYDTIYITGGGSGAGFNDKVSSLNNINNKADISSSKELYDDICLEMRKRNYEFVYDKCMEMLTNYADSLESIDCLSKLYLSALSLDNSGNKMTQLKTFFESLILNNGENNLLIKKTYYLLQKTKVSLGEYQSAMSGFQQIINQNPFSYEGLTAGW
ncbi:MAG TPA: hypothetical protein DCY06_13660, partial [Bacteroidetes bacterium]|nr:hypothetical protein [Bacteroidota bacterium]